ncbi:OmpA/MotB family protein [Paraburkholderia caballeronis]|uniref:Outer membrane protein OmpA n=1 Tax=Paraburkholderia caballeronis TaxID=416943 RepID=A0A1H7SHH3_9BURK|nr:OmpA family protein [Paraburkholderia caballeronis]PXW22307.1 outer membrane protein OmpA-like peptidoglycan-associated protein [Paraburkholderia caballeronis]PXW95966.1 outer membrane protein OmpA-like peptidoglycan-associated protein [Paraburkholderia caballeronis]RAJ92332.1 outer membrane protein OmpA-like peptidoglycan-associated protein [Paraburkholderia caballeronis]TDV27883.1 outer membrane protein OmpA-like peptidoglycan-associated protein [Paraburkholderia caballeronis]SEB52342.1 O
MFSRIVLKRGAKHEGESPFWISFSDLMSALMVLFLVVMAVTLVSVTQSIDAATRANIERSAAINKIMAMIADDPKSVGVGVDQQNYRIDLGKEVRFDSGSYTISVPAAQFLRSYIPVLLNAKDTPEGQRWMRDVVVEGFTDEDGTYLYNLQLSLDRSRSVVCSLFQNASGGDSLSPEQLQKVQKLFLVGGYSFNSIKKDKAESRRVEFKIDFWGLDENRPAPNDVLNGKEFGKC